MGTVADSKLREKRREAHQAIDPIWKSGKLSRSEVYKQLSVHLGIDPEKCHIAMFDFETCNLVIDFADCF